MTSKPTDWMQLALQEAKTTKNQKILPNPRVGCVIVHKGKLISSGAHEGPGRAHAERVAIQRAEKKGFKKFNEAELYLSLEPCCHENKRTPPCLPLVLEKKFKQIYIAHADPNPEVSGRSIRQLRKNSKVKIGLLRKEAEEMNQAFLKNQQQQLPYVHLKIAMSFDGRFAASTGSSKWITNEESRKRVHQMRRAAQWVGVGAGTLDADNPSLNSRIGNEETENSILIFGRPRTPRSKLKLFQKNASSPIHFVSRRTSLKESLQELYQEHGVCEIFVEAGPRLATAFLEEKLVDKISIFYGKGFFGGSARYSIGEAWTLKKPEESASFGPLRVELLKDSDLFVEGFFHVYRSRTV